MRNYLFHWKLLITQYFYGIVIIKHSLCKISKMQYTTIVACRYCFCALFLHILSKNTTYLLNSHIGMVLHM